MVKEALPKVSINFDFPMILDNLIINKVPQMDWINNKGNHGKFMEISPMTPPNGI